MSDNDVTVEPPVTSTGTTTAPPEDHLKDPLTQVSPSTSNGGTSPSPGGGGFKAALGQVVQKATTGSKDDPLQPSTLQDKVTGGQTAPDPRLDAMKSPGAVAVDEQVIDESLLQDNDRAENEKIAPRSSYADADQQQAYTYMLWVAEYEQKESLIHFFEKQTQGLRERILAHGLKANLLPKKQTPVQEEAEAKKKELEAQAAREKELAEREAKRKQELEAREKADKEDKGFWGGLWGGLKKVGRFIADTATTVGRGVADGAAWLGNKVVDGAKFVANGVAKAVSGAAKLAGYEKIDWAKLAGLMRNLIAEDKKGNTGDLANKEEPSKALDYVGYGVAGGGAAQKGGEKIADLHNTKIKDEGFLAATRSTDGVQIGTGAQKTTLGFNAAGGGLGFADNVLSGIKAGKDLANKDSDGVGDASATLDLVKTGASASNNIVNLVKASSDLHHGASGVVMTAAQLGLALGIGQIIGGTADLVKGILNVIDGVGGRKKLNALREKMEGLKDVIEPKMYASVMAALGTAENQILTGATDIVAGAAGIVGGALLIALGISNPIGAIIVGVAGIVGGVVAAYKWKKQQDTMRKLVDDHPAFKEKIGALSNKYRAAKEQDAKKEEAAKAQGTEKPKPDPFAKYIDDRAGVGDAIKGKLTGDKDNDGPKEAIRRIVLQEHGFVDVADYQSFHNETLAKYLHALLAKGDPKNLEPEVRAEVEAAATVVSTLGIKPTWGDKGLTKPTGWEPIAKKL